MMYKTPPFSKVGLDDMRTLFLQRVNELVMIAKIISSHHIDNLILQIKSFRKLYALI